MTRSVVRATLVLAGALVLAASAATSARAAGSLSYVTSVALGSRAHDLVIVGDRAYVATDAGMAIVDVSNPASPAVLGSVATGVSRRGQGIAVAGEYVYLAVQASGIFVIDATVPAAPKVVGVKRLPGAVWDVAVRGTVLYAVTFAGELYVLDITAPATPVVTKTIGLLAWSSAKHDQIQIKRLNEYRPSGSAKATWVSVRGSLLFTNDWNYGRIYVYDVSQPANPVYRGTHYVPFVLGVEADAQRDTVYMLAAYGRFSGIHTVPLSMLDPTRGSRYDTCEPCQFLPSRYNVDQGGLGLSPDGAHLVWAGGKRELHVIDADDPSKLVDEAYVLGADHDVPMAQLMGVGMSGPYVFVGGGVAGLLVYTY